MELWSASSWVQKKSTFVSVQMQVPHRQLLICLEMMIWRWGSLVWMPSSDFSASDLMEVWKMICWWFRTVLYILGGGFKHFIFYPYPGKWSNLTGAYFSNWLVQPPTTVDGSEIWPTTNPVNNGINHLSTITWLAGFHPSTVAYLTLSVSLGLWKARLARLRQGWMSALEVGGGHRMRL